MAQEDWITTLQDAKQLLIDTVRHAQELFLETTEPCMKIHFSKHSMQDVTSVLLESSYELLTDIDACLQRYVRQLICSAAGYRQT